MHPEYGIPGGGMVDHDDKAGWFGLIVAKVTTMLAARPATQTAQQFRAELQLAREAEALSDIAVGSGQSSYASWLAKKYVDETCTQMRVSWETYVKFYTVFFTVNFTAIAVTIQYLDGKTGRAAMCLAFVVQNLLASGTALRMGLRAPQLQRQCETYAQIGATVNNETLPAALLQSPILGKLGLYAGIANFIGHLVFITVWMLMFFRIA